MDPQNKPSDVLVIQGMGRSRWRVGDRLSSPVHYGQNNFSESIINEELSAGDILYIPKGFPHESMSSEATLSYCLHFWTDNSLRMIRNWTESLSDENHRGIEYAPSPDLLLRDDPTEILPQDITAVQEMMSQFLLQKRPRRCLKPPMSYRRHLRPRCTPLHRFQTLLQQGHRLHRLMGLRILHIVNRYFVNGESLDSDHADAWNILARHRTIDGLLLSHMIQDPSFMAQLTLLINQGYWYF